MITEILTRGASVIPVLLSVFSILLISVVIRFLRYRLAFHKLHGPLSAPPFSTLFGTMPTLADIYNSCPQDTHPANAFTLLWRKYSLGDMYFMDNWPLAPERQMVINDPTLAAQIVQTHSLPKHPIYRLFATHICGKTSMIFSEGELWKQSRSLFNPGFSASHLMTLVPIIVDDTLIFWKNLKGVADSNEIVQLERMTAHLTIDIMGHVILDHSLNSQTEQNKLVDAFRHAISWTPTSISIFNPFGLLDPIRPIAHWYWTRVMDGYLTKVIINRYEMLQNGSIDSDQKCAIDLALAQCTEQQGEQKDGQGHEIDKATMQLIIDGMKTFLFAGHDTSSSTLCYVYHLLDLNPKCLAKVIAEHNDIFGKDTSMTAETIKKTPQLLNKLPYTLAVMKETLRLFPAAITTRSGAPDISITHPNGRIYPTENNMIWINTFTIHRRADLFPSPDSFIPERFLEQEIPKDAWRPFEKGPRSCIGQELALLEMKVILSLTVRDFVIKDAYEEWDRRLGREEPGSTVGGKRGVFGESSSLTSICDGHCLPCGGHIEESLCINGNLGYRAYQVVKASAKPADDMPVRVTRRSAPPI